jgi:predicted RNase H-like HicB family nuclease
MEKYVQIYKWQKGVTPMSYKVSIVIEKDENGYYAYSPELGGCQTQGDSLEEIIANMKEAIELYIETLTEPAFGFSEAKAAIGYTSGPKQESLFHSIREKHCIQKSSNKSIRL